MLILVDFVIKFVAMRRLVFLLVLLGMSPAFGQEKMIVRAAGVSLVWEDEKEMEKAFDHSPILHAHKPVTLAMIIISGDKKKIVSINRDKSKLENFGDNVGTKMKAGLEHFPKIAKDGSAAVIDISGDKPLARGAELIVAKGTIQLSVASKTNAKRSKLVAVRKGSKVDLGKNFAFEISDAGKPDWGEDPLSITLKISRDIPEVAKVRFFDEEGEQIEASQAGSSRGGFFGKVTVTRDYNLKRKVGKVFVEMDIWTDLEEKTVPFDLKVGVGGGSKK